MPALLELQRSFARQLLGDAINLPTWASDCGVPAAAGLQVYRHNAREQFQLALRLTYPVLLRRVGDAYFRQLARSYRTAYPSPAGDLHEIGRCFPAFLVDHLGATPYAWLADLALLEWAVASAAVAAESPAARIDALACVPESRLEFAVFRLVASLHLVRSTVPVLSIWRQNQSDAAGRPVDLERGAEFVRVHRGTGDVVLRPLERDEHSFTAAIAAGATLGAALEASQLQIEALPGVLQRLFLDEVVTSIEMH